MRIDPKGAEASRLRQRKFQLLRTLKIPPEALPGSLALLAVEASQAVVGYVQCVHGEGHPSWSLTFMGGGEKRVEYIPTEWVEEVRRRVELGRQAKEGLAEILAANAQLLALERRQRRQ